MVKTIIWVILLAIACAWLVYEITGLVPTIRKYIKKKKGLAASSTEVKEEEKEGNPDERCE